MATRLKDMITAITKAFISASDSIRATIAGVVNVDVSDMDELYDYDSEDTTIYETVGYGGSDHEINDLIRHTLDIDLTSKLGAAVDFKFNATGGTDQLVVSLFKRRDTKWSGTEIAIWSGNVANDGSEDVYHFTIDEAYGAGHFRFGLNSAGATDTFQIDVKLRKWNKKLMKE